MVQIQHPTSAETRMWGKRLAAMLVIYTSRGVAPEVNLRECISCMPPQSWNKAAHSGFESKTQEVQNRGISGPKNEHVSNKNFFKKKVLI